MVPADDLGFTAVGRHQICIVYLITQVVPADYNKYEVIGWYHICIVQYI